MGKIYLVPQGVTRTVAGWDELGPDADDPELDLATWRARIQRHRGELKNLLREQSFVAGIGNGYSDEILWTAGLAPVSQALDAGSGGGRSAVRRDQGHPGLGHRRASAPSAARLRGRGAGLPARPSQGRSPMSPLWDHRQRDRARRLRDQLLPRLPTLTCAKLRLAPSRPRLRQPQDLARPEVARVADVVERLRTATVVPKRAAMPLSVSPDLTL